MVKATSSELVIADYSTPGTPAYLEGAINNAKHQALWLEKSVMPFVESVDELKGLNWRDSLNGKPKTWGRFCEEIIGLPAKYIEDLRRGAAILQEQGRTGALPEKEVQAALGKHGTNQYSEGRSVRTSSRGESVTYLRARLERDRPEILAALDRGEFPSVRQAAIAAGIIRVHGIVYRLQRLWEKATPEQRNEFLNWTEANDGR